MTERLPKALLLEMDDTLLDFDSHSEGCWRTVCEQSACRADNLPPERLLQAINEYRLWFWSDPDRHLRGRMNLEKARQEIVEGALERLGLNAPALATQIAEAYATARDEAICLFPDTLATLDRLQGLGIVLALITNGHANTQRRKIERFALKDYFEVIVVEGEFGLGKPDERVYMHALDKLNALPGDAWMVGDNLEWDVAAPQRLGIRGIWYDLKRNGLPEGSTVRPDRIIRTLGELVD